MQAATARRPGHFCGEGRRRAAPESSGRSPGPGGGVANEGIRELKDKWHVDHGALHHPTGMSVLWALLAAGFNLFQLVLARRIRKRSTLEETDRGVAERLRAELLVWAGNWERLTSKHWRDLW